MELRKDNKNVAFFLTLFVLEMTEITDDRYDFKKTVHRIGRSGGTFITNPQYILAFLRCPIDVSLFPFDQQFCNITVTDGQSVINVKYKGFGFHQGEFLFLTLLLVRIQISSVRFFTKTRRLGSVRLHIKF